MKRTNVIMIALLVLALILAGCAEDEKTDENTNVLTVTSGDTEHTFTQDDLKKLPQTTATFNDVEYVGVQIPALLEAAEIEFDGISAVKAVAADGFTVNYEPSMVAREDVIVAYALPDGPMSEDDGNYRMVLPGEEGKLNPRMVVKITVVK